MSEITIDEIAARIPAHVAQLAVARAFAVIGREGETDSGTLNRMLLELEPALTHMGVSTPDLSFTAPGHEIPHPYSIEETACEWWERVSLT